MYSKALYFSIMAFVFLLIVSTARADNNTLCPSPYHVLTSDNRCVWSCSTGTTPDNPSNECACQPGYTQTGTDSFGRRTCSNLTSASPSTTPSSSPSTSSEPTASPIPYDATEPPKSEYTYTQCNPNNLIYCADEPTCKLNGGKWCDNKCLFECAYQPKYTPYPYQSNYNQYPTQQVTPSYYPYRTQQYTPKTSEKPKPTELKQDNSADPLSILSSVLQLEQLKVKIDILRGSVKKLVNYHNSKGNLEYSNKWEAIFSNMEEVTQMMSGLADSVRSAISDFTKDDLSKFKSELKNIADKIQAIIKRVADVRSTQPSKTPQKSPTQITSPSVAPSNSTQPTPTSNITPLPTETIEPSTTPSPATEAPSDQFVKFRTKPGTYNWHNWGSTLRGEASYSRYNITNVEYYFKKLSDGSYYSPRGTLNTPDYKYWSPNETIYNRSSDVPSLKYKSFYMQVFIPGLTPGDTYEFGVRVTKQDGTKTDWYKAQYKYESVPEKYVLLKTPVNGQQFKIGDKVNITGQCFGDMPAYKCPENMPECDSSTWSASLKQQNPDGTWRDSWNPITTSSKVNNTNGTCNYQWPIQSLLDCVLVVETTSTGTTRGYNCTPATSPRLAQFRLSVSPSCLGSNAPDRVAGCIGRQVYDINITISP